DYYPADYGQTRQKDRVQEGEDRNRHAHVAPHFEWHRTERGDRIERKIPQPPICPVCTASVPFWPIIDNRSLPEADPGEQTLHEPRALGKTHQHIHYSRVQTPEVPGVGRNWNISDTAEYAGQ